MNSTTKIIAITTASLALAGGVTAGIAAADPTASPTPTPTTSAGPSTQTDKKATQPRVRGARMLRRALHGEVTLAGPQHQVVLFQRGKVDKVGKSSITVHSNDDFVGTYAVALATRVRVEREPATIDRIEAGDRVLVIAVKGGDLPTARLVVERGA